MKKYYLMAIEKGDNDAIYKLGNYYQFIEKNKKTKRLKQVCFMSDFYFRNALKLGWFKCKFI